MAHSIHSPATHECSQHQSPVTIPTAHSSHKIPMITPPAHLNPGLNSTPASAFTRHSAITSAGIKRLTAITPSGTMMMSSRYPITGTGSGIKSIGLAAYAITASASALAYHGVFSCLSARYITATSRRRCLVFAFSL